MCLRPTKIVVLENVLGFRQLLQKVVALLRRNVEGHHDCKKLFVCSRFASTTCECSFDDFSFATLGTI